MGLFNKLFSGSEEPKQQSFTPWITLDKIEQLDTIIELSNNKPQLIFKHSTRCGISRMVISQFKKDYELKETEADLYYLDMIANRDISNTIAERLDVRHESPQLLVIKNGVVVAHESHGAINSLKMDKYL
jgi:bacillithiol system protein YtxJ